MTRAKDISKIITDADFSGSLDVTGTVTAGGLTVEQSGNDVSVQFNNTNNDFTTATSSALRLSTTASDNNLYYGEIKVQENSADTSSTNMLFYPKVNQLAMKLNNNGDISFYEDTGTTPKLFWDASTERLGIGTTSPSANAIHAVGSSSMSDGIILESQGVGDSEIEFRNTSSGNHTWAVGLDQSNSSAFGIGYANASGASLSTHNVVTINTLGNVGIGGTSFNPKLYVLNSNAGPGLTAANATAVFHGSVDIGKGGCIGFDFGASHTNYPVGLGYVITSQSGSTKGDLAFFTRNVTTDTAPTERMRMTSAGQLLIARTATSGVADGHRFDANGFTQHVRDGGEALEVVRETSDGNIIVLKKDTTTVGSMGTQGGDLVIHSSITGHCGFRFTDEPSALPTNNSGTVTDNSMDLGRSANRYDDIFATNGTIQTSDRNEKQDIEELSDAEQRVAVVAKGLMRKFRWKDKVAEKGDNARTHFGIIAQDLQDAFTAEGLDAGDYAMFTSNTWWELDGETYNTEEEAPEGATQKTRLGVRYNQLLAFIISAI